MKKGGAGMGNLERRIDRIEEQLEPEGGRQVRIRPPIITGWSGRQPTAEEARELGPVDGWITYRQQLQMQEQASAEYLGEHPGCLGRAITIDLDADREYRARAERQSGGR
jgi:hypothetical protein